MKKQADWEILKAGAIEKAPYFAQGIVTARIVPTPGLGTFAVTRHLVILADPNVVAWDGVRDPENGVCWKVREACGVLLHEFHHWLRQHHARWEVVENAWRGRVSESALHSVRSISIDVEVNDDLEAEGVALPASGFTTRTVNEHLAKVDSPVRLLPSRLLEEHARLLLDAIEAGELPEGKLPTCMHPHLELDDGNEMPAVTGIAADILRDSIARAVLQAEHQPGLRRWAETRIIEHRVSWEEELRAATSQALAMSSGTSELSWDRPSRRQRSELLEPLRVDLAPRVALVLDTSGSMTLGARLPRALGVVQGVLRAVGVQGSVPVVCCDAAVASVEHVASVEGLELAGGGGTDLSAGIEWVDERDHDVCVVVTDGETPWPATEPRVRVVACLVGSHPDPIPRWVWRTITALDDEDGEE